MGRAEWIAKELRRGSTAGFVTRIHPFIYRRIANDLVTLCRKRKMSFRSFGAVSLTEVLWGLAASDPACPESGAARGLRVFDIDYLVREPALLQPAFGTVVYCIADDARRKALCALLRRRYPKTHRFYLLAGSGDKEDEAVPAGAAEVEERLLGMDSGALLYAPPDETRKKR
jgi:hypothetical protein